MQVLFPYKTLSGALEPYGGNIFNIESSLVLKSKAVITLCVNFCCLGIGYKTAKRLEVLGINSVHDLQTFPIKTLEKELGIAIAQRIQQLSFGEDKSPVTPSGPPQVCEQGLLMMLLGLKMSAFLFTPLLCSAVLCSL